MFERADGGGSNSDDPAGSAQGIVNRGGCGGGNGIRLGVDFVIFDSVDADGLKSSKADVKCNVGGFNAADADAIEDGGSEMKSGGRSGD